MVSLTQKTEAQRRRKAATVGRDKKKERAKNGTPKFPIHLEGVEVVAKKAAAKR